MEMFCLSIKQPWAWCIFNAAKDIENRSWRTNFRGPLLIHASKKIDKQAYEYLIDNKEYYGIKQMPSINELQKISGGLYGILELTSCKKHSTSIWKDSSLYGWGLKNQSLFNFYPYKGRLGLFKIDLTRELKTYLGLYL